MLENISFKPTLALQGGEIKVMLILRLFYIQLLKCKIMLKQS